MDTKLDTGERVLSCKVFFNNFTKVSLPICPKRNYFLGGGGGFNVTCQQWKNTFMWKKTCASFTKFSRNVLHCVGPSPLITLKGKYYVFSIQSVLKE